MKIMQIYELKSESKLDTRTKVFPVSHKPKKQEP